MSNTVPEGWSTAELTKFCEVVGGGTPDRSVEEYWNGDIPWASPTEITSLFSKHISKTKESITQKGLEKSSAKLHPAGTVLMTSRASIGYVAINTVAMATNQGFQSLRCKENTCADYIYQHITWIRPELEKMSAGSTFSEISSSSVKKLRVTLPPLLEQKKIAAILSSVDDVIEKTRAQIDKLKYLKTGMMQELLTIGVGHTEFKDSPVGRIPAGWEVKSLGEVANVTKLAGFEYTNHFDYSVGGEIIALRALNLTNGRLDLTNIQTIPKSVSDTLPRSKLFKGDILITYVGANIGEIGLVDEDDKYHLAPNVGKISFDRSVAHAGFMFQQILSQRVQRAIRNLTSVTSQPSLNMSNIRNIPILILPRSEQEKISKILFGVDNKIETSQRKLHKLASMKKALMQDLLTGKVRVKVDQKESAVA